MISVIIPTCNCERELIPVLSALVPGVTAGVLREVILMDSGSSDGTAAIADAAGCALVSGAADLGERLRHGARLAHSSWLLFLQSDSLLEEGWPRDVAHFLATAERRAATDRMTATFRLAVDGQGLRPRLDEGVATLLLALFGMARSGQGLLISRSHYERIEGHARGARHELHLARRLDRRALHALRARVLRIGAAKP